MSRSNKPPHKPENATTADNPAASRDKLSLDTQSKLNQTDKVRVEDVVSTERVIEKTVETVTREQAVSYASVHETGTSESGVGGSMKLS